MIERRETIVLDPHDRKALIGNYHGTAPEYITLLEGIRRVAPETMRIHYSEGCALRDNKVENLAYENDRLSEAMIVTQNSDVVIVAVGLNENLEGEEGDAGNSYASGDKLDLSYAAENFDAVLMLWYPGAQGGLAAARILFGDVSPSGKLCVTFYDPDYPLPEFTDYSMKRRTYRYMDAPAQYPFGYGLTYGDVLVTDAQLLAREQAESGRKAEKPCRKLSVSFCNRGQVSTKEVIEVYVDPVDSPFRTRKNNSR